MLFDTGSSEFWIPSEDCTTDLCKMHRRYHKSLSYVSSPQKLKIMYMSGKVIGDMAYESI